MKEIFRRRNPETLVTTVVLETATGTLLGTIYASGSLWPDACVDLTADGGKVRDGLYQPTHPCPHVQAAARALC